VQLADLSVEENAAFGQMMRTFSGLEHEMGRLIIDLSKIQSEQQKNKLSNFLAKSTFGEKSRRMIDLLETRFGNLGASRKNFTEAVDLRNIFAHGLVTRNDNGPITVTKPMYLPEYGNMNAIWEREFSTKDFSAIASQNCQNVLWLEDRRKDINDQAKRQPG